MNDGATSSGNLDGLIAVVTGAAQGLGLGITEQLARDGATAIIADLQRDKGRTEAAMKVRFYNLYNRLNYLCLKLTFFVCSFFFFL